MEKRWRNLAFAGVCTLCILFCSTAAFPVDVPEKLKDIPLYQGSTVKQAMDMANHAMLVAAVKAKGSAIADFYKNAMKAEGWKVAFQAEQEDMMLIHFQKGKRMVQLTIQLEKGGEATTYNLMTTSED
ncbi:MAG TPA: hypothetical protein VEF34_09375 [Syntrophobacteraceae bacterium]|nr:hypothetical protein [Syntrophobacteraceae bacterium]